MSRVRRSSSSAGTLDRPGSSSLTGGVPRHPRLYVGTSRVRQMTAKRPRFAVRAVPSPCTRASYTRGEGCARALSHLSRDREALRQDAHGRLLRLRCRHRVRREPRLGLRPLEGSPPAGPGEVLCQRGQHCPPRPEARRQAHRGSPSRAAVLRLLPAPLHRTALDAVAGKAANDAREALESPIKEFVVINVPPGAGKSTLFGHDIPLWLICRDRAVRILYGSNTERQAKMYTGRLRDSLERTSAVPGDEQGEGAGLDRRRRHRHRRLRPVQAAHPEGVARRGVHGRAAERHGGERQGAHRHRLRAGRRRARWSVRLRHLGRPRRRQEPAHDRVARVAQGVVAVHCRVTPRAGWPADPAGAADGQRRPVPLRPRHGRRRAGRRGVRGRDRRTAQEVPAHHLQGALRGAVPRRRRAPEDGEALAGGVPARPAPAELA
jgi:hypothetical protein